MDEEKKINGKFVRGNRRTFQLQGFETAIHMGALLLHEGIGLDDDKTEAFKKSMFNIIDQMRHSNDDCEALNKEFRKGIEVEYINGGR